MNKTSRKIGIGINGACAGERHYNSKLTDHEVELILELLTGGMPAKEIAEKFEIAVRTVYRYNAGERRVYASFKYTTTGA